MRVNMHHNYLERDLSCAEGVARTRKDFHWLEKSVPCQHACPAGTDIPAYLGAIAAGDFTGAYKINLRDNVFPAVLGRICTRPCERVCRHGYDGLGDSVAICFSKRSAADYGLPEEYHVLPALFPASGKKVAVIGSGPSGLAAARDLCLLGHEVVVYEQYHLPGGMLTQNIPPFRLPREVVTHEIEQLVKQGVEIRCSCRIGGDISLNDLLQGNDALIVAGGCTRPNIPEIAGLDCQGVLHGSEFLQNILEGSTKQVGSRVVVIGGGFTAVDCARAALRDGAEKVVIFYRRRREDMTLTPGEFEALGEEGIRVEFLAAPTRLTSRSGKLQSVHFERNRIVDGSEGRKCKIEPIDDSGFQVEADTLLLATGQAPAWEWLEESLGSLKGLEGWQVDRGLLPQTSLSSLFIAGDQGGGSSSVIEAVASGRQCARSVDSFLMGTERTHSAVSIAPGREQLRNISDNDIPRQHIMSLKPGERSMHGEVEQGFLRESAVQEATRCYLCHYKYEIDVARCIYCDLCCEVKPLEDCILKVKAVEQDAEQRILSYLFPDDSYDPENQFAYRINPSACIRCNRCLEVCPVGCISVHKVSLLQIWQDTEADPCPESETAL